MSKYILGGGISGLIWKFYNPEFEVVTPLLTRPGTTLKVADPFVRTKMIWLHDCPEVRQFLSDLGWTDVSKFVKKSKIGYYHDGEIYDDLTPMMSRLLVRKKMLEWDKWAPEVPEEITGIEGRLSLTGTTKMTNFMNVIDVDHGQILYKLNSRCDITHGVVGCITDTHIGFTDSLNSENTDYVYKKYDEIVSTIPAPAFWRAWQKGHPDEEIDVDKFRSLPITFVTMKRKPEEFDGDYEMVYYDHNLPFTRISHIDNKYCIEFTGDMPRSVFEKMFPELALGISDYWQLPQGRIRSIKTTPPEKVIFSGRFSEWQHSITTEHVIAQALEYRRKTNESNTAG